MPNKTNRNRGGSTIDGTSTIIRVQLLCYHTDHSDIRIIDVQNDLNENKIELNCSFSVAHVVISDKPTDETVYVEPDIT